MKDMINRITKLFIGCSLASFGITCVLKANLGCFATTATNVTFSNLFGISIGMSGFIIELIMLICLLYLKEGLGISAIINMTYGSLMIDVFNILLPTHPLMLLGLIFVPIGWALVGMSGFGDTNSNLLTTALIKKTGKSLRLIRGIQESMFLLLGLPSGCITWFTLILSLGLGYILQAVYKLMKYEPTEIKHSYLIGGDNFEYQKIYKK